MRMISRPIFGGCDEFDNDVHRAKNRLAEGIELLSGLQQPPRSPDAASAKRNKEIAEADRARLVEIGEDLLTALGIRDKFVLKGKRKSEQAGYADSTSGCSPGHTGWTGAGE